MRENSYNPAVGSGLELKRYKRRTEGSLPNGKK